MNQTHIKITTFINNATLDKNIEHIAEELRQYVQFTAYSNSVTINHTFIDKDIELHAEELRQCTGRNTEAEWKELAPSLYNKYIEAVMRREQVRHDYQMYRRSLKK